MKVDMIPQENLKTNMPIMLKISGEVKSPSVEVKGLGQVPVRKEKEQFVSEFWSQDKGKYQIIVRGENAIWKSMVTIEKQEYITFNQEMTIFGLLIICSAVGLVLWMRRLKKI